MPSSAIRCSDAKVSITRNIPAELFTGDVFIGAVFKNETSAISITDVPFDLVVLNTSTLMDQARFLVCACCIGMDLRKRSQVSGSLRGEQDVSETGNNALAG